ncbi:MAG TPA: transglutaminase family protein [Spirochaetia bacterium]|nr:transglutaminase family protein [Spirochaetia bacterium]
MTFLFITRGVLYLLAFSLPLLHPAIVVTYDIIGWWLWYILVPGEMLIAYFLSPPRFKVGTWLLAAFLLILLPVLFLTGLSYASLLYLLGGSFAFVLTVLIFKTEGRGRSFAVAEVFLLGLLYYKMLSFSRASETIARESSGITQVIFFISIGAFLLHSLVLYLASFQAGGVRKNRRELAFFLALIVPLGLLVSFFLPPDFVGHSIVFNRLKEEPNPELVPLDEYADGLPDGNLLSDRQNGERRDGRRGQRGRDGRDGSEQGGDTEGKDGKNRLEGYPADQWGDQGMGEGGESRQYAVMVVASEVEPVYAAEAYYGAFDPQRGFTLSKDEMLNELTYIRLLETWKNRKASPDAKRVPREIYALSTLPERVLAYEPISVEPTVLNRRFHPFDFSYTAVSAMSRTGIEEWRSLRELSDEERDVLTRYLEIPLEEPERERFSGYLEQIVGNGASYFERILGILRSFSTFQYQIGFDDDVAVIKMDRFLFETREGDCTEFSNTTAILARLAGIPTRVVTGYLAARELQTNAHLRGLKVLMEKVEPLQKYPPQDLYLVTTSAHHSWVQFYLPDYGWVDFETTAFALPPMGNGDPNSMNVVIPLIQAGNELPPEFRFPWLLALKTLVILLAFGVTGAYFYRYAKEIYLVLLSRTQGIRALKALRQLLLMKLAAEGYVIKEPSETLREYSQKYPELNSFTSVYTTLRYRERIEPGEREKSWKVLRDRFRAILHGSRRKGFLSFFRRIFSLKGLRY